MWVRYILIFVLFYAATFFLDFSNWLSQLLFALFTTSIIYLLQPSKSANKRSGLDSEI